MIVARFKQDPDAGRLSMRVSGHAGHGPKGFDVICAGASMLAYTAAQCLDLMAKEGKLEGEPVLNVSEGRLSVSVVPKNEYFREALHVFWVAEVGYQLLAASYPDHVKATLFDPAATAVLKESST